MGGGTFTPVKELYKVKDIVRYKCDTKQEPKYLFGNSLRACLENRTWNGSLPYCVSERQLDSSNADQRVLYDGKTNRCLPYKEFGKHGNEFIKIIGKIKRVITQIISNRNYEIVNVFYVNHYNKLVPFTTASREATDGELFSQWYTYNSLMVIIDPVIKIEVKNFIHSYDRKICEVNIFADIIASCPRLDAAIKGASITFDYSQPNNHNFFEYGSAAVYTCNEGFRLEGNKIRYCDVDNKWTRGNTSCIEIRCTAPSQTIHNGYWTVKGSKETFPVGSTSEVTCEHGYKITGMLVNITCNSVGNWTLSDVECTTIEIRCSTPSQTIHNGYWSMKSSKEPFSVGSTLEVICENGYKRTGMLVNITCESVGNWTLSDVECTAIEGPTSSSRKAVIISIAVVGLLLICLCLGFCIFWTRRSINRSSQKRIHQVELLLDNPVYNTALPDLQDKKYSTSVYFQSQSHSKQSNLVISEEAINAEMVTNELYRTECPIANPLHEYISLVYEEVNKDRQNDLHVRSRPTLEKEMQKVMVENEIYGTE